jgi:topoisomerase-4 subunit A
MDDLPDDAAGPGPDEPLVEPLRTAIGQRYLTYALSTIMHRALPDARDGLKPVHRRILYAMRELRLAPTGGFRKCAKISGDVMGNYHPHGDAAIYDALARLAQPFAMRTPLVDGQGNFGNVDGDNPAAARYTEARLTAAAEALLEGLGEDAVDFRDNYDGTLTEPVVLPARFPNLLANGASGIAVGMATSIPPHNVAELCTACLYLIQRPEAPDDALLHPKRVQGPDFPTGGVVVEEPEAMARAYRTGRGGFRLRATWEREDLGRGTWQAVVTEIPYGVPKARLVERLAELIQTKKLPILADVRDESAEDIRLVLEPRSKAVDPDVLMGMLFRLSDLEIRVPLNMNVLIDGRTPKVCSMKEVLRAFLDHRREVLLRRSRHRLGRIERRLEVLDGYLTAYLNLDRVIAIIRAEDQPKPVLMAEFSLSDVQAEAILNMRLRALRRLEEMELRAERDGLLAEQAGLRELTGSEEAQWKRISDELRETRKAFAKGPGVRRTRFAVAAEVADLPLEAMVEREPVTVVCSQMGWIRAAKGHVDLAAPMRFKDGDGPRFAFHAETTDRLIAFGTNGRAYTIPVASLPGGRGQGEPLRLMVDLPQDADLVDLFVHVPGRRLLVASDEGFGFVAPEDEVVAQTRGGKGVLNLGPARARVVRPVEGDHVAVVGENRKMVVFPLEELPVMARGRGVRMQRYQDGGLSDARVFTLGHGLVWLDGGGRTRTQRELDDWMAKRGAAGRMAPRGFPRDNRFS